VAADLRARGARVAVIPADLTHRDAPAAVVADATAALGPVDLLVNNAAVEHAGPFTALDQRTIADTVALNVTAAIELTRLVLPDMLTRRRGHVVNLASIAGRKGPPYDALYAGTKAALLEWSSALRIELRGSGVGLSCILPGYVREEGMFARLGVQAPWILGSTTPARVAEVVVRVAERDRAEQVVNSMPVRPFLALYALAPGLFDRLLHWTGVVAVQRRKVGLDDTGT